ncbi:rRNA maturation RNase YbeY [Tunturiibacter gelidoferens]|uniref:rRNA maturation factor n=1 Tax=Tunturiibacter gelidiferens TaxID=3069689 RepID=A0ACC5P4V2_9BACT|nr:rRNA maturation RNase YbeY [Edaphobacter lichenicola]MBB5341873.1 putative rRNA maturation factor [Edaphobacter lichenicola]
MITIELPSSIKENLSRPGLTSFLNRARLAAGVTGQVEVLLADDLTLRRLNRSFRGKNKPTDVLSFPTPAEISDIHAGDLAISLETAARQAAIYGHSLRDEVQILLLHGLLHLSGLDHETDDGEMAARETTLRSKLKLSNTLIERTTAHPRKLLPPATKKSASRLKTPSVRSTKKSLTLTKKSSSRPKAALYAAAVESPPHSAGTTKELKSAKIKPKRGAK